MTKFMKKWHGLFERTVGKDRYANRLWWLNVAVYPRRAWFKDPNDRCSLCRPMWSNIEGAISHVTGIHHFRMWCLEHTELAVKRWGEDVRTLIAEERLAGADKEPKPREVWA